MRGDADYGSQHKHGIREEGKAASGVHLQDRTRLVARREIAHVHESYRGHFQLDFTDGTSILVERGDYAEKPKKGDLWPPVGVEPKSEAELYAQALKIVMDAGYEEETAKRIVAENGVQVILAQQSSVEAENAERNSRTSQQEGTAGAGTQAGQSADRSSGG